MPLPFTPRLDLLVWRGTYSVKSGYKVLLQGLPSTPSSALNITLPQVSPTSEWLPCYIGHLGHRNKVVHDQADFNLPSLITFFKSYMNDMDNLQPMATSLVLSLDERWSPPCTGLVKVNFDAAFDSTTSYSFSDIIIQDNAGDILAAGCFSHPHVDPFTIEAIACHQALVLAHDLFFNRIIIEGDSLSVIKKVYNFFEDRLVIGILIKDILGNFESTTALFYPRVCNKPTHLIVDLGRYLDWECSTPN
ncbi:hypothetical protein V6N13_068279 [Hibiscus sabdariffa]